MPEVLGDPPSPRTALFWNGTAWQWALVDAAGNLQIDVLSTVMDAAGATAAAQALALAQLQTIAEIRDALQSVNTDALQVRGEDQLFSYAGTLAHRTVGNPVGVYMEMESAAVPAGEVWVVTTIVGRDNTTAITAMQIAHRRAGVSYYAWESIRAFAINEFGFWGGHLYLEEGDTIQITFVGGLNTDTCHILLNGYIMTLET